ncbi:MAG: ATP-binding cassette domain-containing protein, partial [Desulfobacterales bacterium]|nr:ATP-binding cassette domain-containing protein [Desulfobacterales bacterium]
HFNFSLAPGDTCSISADFADDAHLLASALATLAHPISGKYIFQETELDFGNYQKLLEFKRQIGYFGPHAAMVSNLTVRQNLLLSRAYFENRLDLDLDDNVEGLCDEFQLIEKLDLRPTALSHLDIRAAILAREITKPLKLLIMDSPEDLIGHPGFGFLVAKVEQLADAGVPLVLLCENDELITRLTDLAVRIPMGDHKM